MIAEPLRAQENVHEWQRSELGTRGAGRLAEVFRTLHPIESWSNDRYSLRFIGSGIGGLHGTGPTIEVDGIPMPFFLFDRSMVEFIPVSPSDIDSLGYSPERTILPLGLTADGVLRIKTARPQGWSLRSEMGLINETGDPGPAIHQDTSLTNVDRSGPVTSTRLSFGKNPWFVEAGLNSDLYHITDEELSGRQWLVFGAVRQPVVSLFNPFLRFSYQKESSSLEVLAGSARKSDHQFLEIAGWEWPNRQQWDWIKGIGSFRVSDSGEIGLRWSVDRVDITNRASKISLPAEMQMSESRAEAFAGFHRDSHSLEIAGGMKVNSVNQSGTVMAPDSEVLYGRLTTVLKSASTQWTSTIQVLSNIGESDTGSKTVAQISTQMSWHAQNGSLVRLNAAFMNGLPSRDWSTMSLVARGVTFNEFAAHVSPPVASTRERELDAGLHASVLLAETMSFWLDVRMRNSSGLTLPDRQIEQPFGIGPLLPETAWSTGKTGWVFSRGAGIVNRWRSSISRLSYQFYHVSSEGDTVFWRHYTGYPRHRVNASVSIRTSDRISVFASVGVASKWIWPEYNEPARRTIPASADLEMTVSKGLFASRMHMAFSFLNIMDNGLGNHPAGVFEQFAMRVRLSTRLSRSLSGN